MGWREMSGLGGLTRFWRKVVFASFLVQDGLQAKTNVPQGLQPEFLRDAAARLKDAPFQTRVVLLTEFLPWHTEFFQLTSLGILY